MEAALEVRNRELAPLSWAESMANLAGTYVDIGKRSGDASCSNRGWRLSAPRRARSPASAIR